MTCGMSSLNTISRKDIRLAGASRSFSIRQPKSRQSVCVKAAGSSYGHMFRVTTFGESHGGGVGCVVDGVPARLQITQVRFNDQYSSMMTHCDRNHAHCRTRFSLNSTGGALGRVVLLPLEKRQIRAKFSLEWLQMERQH